MSFEPENNDTRTLEQKVDAIPGGDGWYKSAARDEYLRSAEALIRLGMSEDEAVLFLFIFTARPKAALGARMSDQVIGPGPSEKTAAALVSADKQLRAAYDKWADENGAYLSGLPRDLSAAPYLAFVAGWDAAQAADVWE